MVYVQCTGQRQEQHRMVSDNVNSIRTLKNDQNKQPANIPWTTLKGTFLQNKMVHIRWPFFCKSDTSLAVGRANRGDHHHNFGTFPSLGGGDIGPIQWSDRFLRHVSINNPSNFLSQSSGANAVPIEWSQDMHYSRTRMSPKPLATNLMPAMWASQTDTLAPRENAWHVQDLLTGLERATNSCCKILSCTPAFVGSCHMTISSRWPVWCWNQWLQCLPLFDHPLGWSTRPARNCFD